MSAVQTHLSFAIGSVFALLALTLGLLGGASFEAAVFRAVVVMCLASLVCAWFLRYFTGIVHNFVEDRVREQQAEEERLKRESANPTAG
jgi:predicted membrane protein